MNTKYSNIDFSLLKLVKFNDYVYQIMYNNIQLYFTTSFLSFGNSNIKIESNDPNICVELYPEMKIYHFYKNLDKFVSELLKYISIINEGNNIINVKYYLRQGNHQLCETNGKTHTLFNINTFEGLKSYINYGYNIRFIIKPILFCNKDIYYIKLYVNLICINKTNTIKYDYDYDYILKRIQNSFRQDIHAIKYIPRNLKELIENGEINTFHLFKK